MNAIRKIMTREGNSLHVMLPENFKAEQVELIILPYGDSALKSITQDTEIFQKELKLIFGKFNADLSGFKFNREDLYDRE